MQWSLLGRAVPHQQIPYPPYPPRNGNLEASWHRGLLGLCWYASLPCWQDPCQHGARTLLHRLCLIGQLCLRHGRLLCLMLRPNKGLFLLVQCRFRKYLQRLMLRFSIGMGSKYDTLFSGRQPRHWFFSRCKRSHLGQDSWSRENLVVHVQGTLLAIDEAARILLELVGSLQVVHHVRVVHLYLLVLDLLRVVVLVTRCWTFPL